MKKNQRQIGLYYAVMLVLLVIGIALRCIACFTELNYKTGYFGNDVCITLANSLVISAAIICFSYIFVADKDFKLCASFDNALTYIPGGAVSAGLLFLSVKMISTVKNEHKILFSKSTFANYESALMLLVGLLAMAGIMNFLFNALSEKRADTTRAGFAIAMSIFLAIYGAYLYFSTELPLNAPNKLIDMLAYLFASIFFLYEARLSLGRDMWRPYIAFGLIGALLTGYSALPSLIIYFANGEVISNSVAENTLSLTLCIFITARLFLATKLDDGQTSDVALAVEKMVSCRMKEMVGEIDEELSYAGANINNEENATETPAEDMNYTINLSDDTSADAKTSENISNGEEKE